MNRHFKKALDKIKVMLLSLGAAVEDRVHLAAQAIASYDADIARQIISTDQEIDDMEVEIEEECLKALALHQPVAVDLRFLIAVIKINSELERIGDEAVNIAERIETISQLDTKALFRFDYGTMVKKALNMLKISLDSLVNMDSDMAYRVLTLDDEVDALKKVAYDAIKEEMRGITVKLGYFINLLLISRHVERLADHATNIAEEVIYMVEGEIVRHSQL